MTLVDETGKWVYSSTAAIDTIEGDPKKSFITYTGPVLTEWE